MARLLDTSLWIDLTRSRSPRALKSFVAGYVDDPRACLAEPIVFEVLRGATDAEARVLMAYFHAVPLLASPPDLWGRGVALGRGCRCGGFTAGSIDLLIAAIAIYHDAELLTFDEDFSRIAGASKLRFQVLQRPA